MPAKQAEALAKEIEGNRAFDVVVWQGEGTDVGYRWVPLDPHWGGYLTTKKVDAKGRIGRGSYSDRPRA